MNEIIKSAEPAACFDIQRMTFEQVERFATMIAASTFVPASFKGKVGDVIVGMSLAAQLRISWLSLLRNLAVINGRPTIWGDLALTLARQHPDFVGIREWDEGETAICEIRIRGRLGEGPQAITRKFSQTDAKNAGLAGKEGPWRQFPQRMRQMRARSWAIRDALPEALNGVEIAEDVMDVDPQGPDRVSGVDRLAAAIGVEQPRPIEAVIVPASPDPDAAVLDREEPHIDEPEPEPELDLNDTTAASPDAKKQLVSALRAKGIDPLPWVEDKLGRTPSPDVPLMSTEVQWLLWHAKRL